MAKGQGKVGQAKSGTVAQMPFACADEASAVDLFEQIRWGTSPTCVHCKSNNVYKMINKVTLERNKDFRWRCMDCKKMYTVRIGTVMECSRIPFRYWCYAYWAACSSKKGVSSKQIQRMTGLSYKSALFMMHRIREAMTDQSDALLTGIVEADETYVGGKPRYKGNNKRGRGTKKTPVFGVVQRNGKVKSKVLPDVTAYNLKKNIDDLVDLSAKIITDDNPSYGNLNGKFSGHETVCHSSGEYVKIGDIHTNTIEGVWSLLKRGMYGTFHSVSKKHLARYLCEFDFRYNSRDVEDGERTVLAIMGSIGKRLTYRGQVSGICA